MKYKNIVLFFTMILYCFTIYTPCYASENTASTISALSVKGNQLVDESGTPIQLKGISTHGIAWFPDYINEYCFKELKQKWGMNVIRIAMYTAESGGYCTDGNKEYLKNLVKKGVEYATKCDMYVIIDWHILSDGNPNTYIEESKAFFDEMSKTYCNQKNVIYEICNEPNGSTSYADIKQYAKEVIPVIRKYAADAGVLVGKPKFCTTLEDAIKDPLPFENIMYTYHYYSDVSDCRYARSQITKALDNGIPVFASEWGYKVESKTLNRDTESLDLFLDFLEERGISWVNWALSNKKESYSLISSKSKALSGWTEEELTPSGKYVVARLKERPDASAASKAQEEGYS